MTDTQPISTQVMCLACYTPTPLRDLAHDPLDIPVQLCLRCAAREAIGDCEPAQVTPAVTSLPDIDQYQGAAVIPEDDVRIDTFSNTAMCVVRATHMPTGFVATAEREPGEPRATTRKRALGQLQQKINNQEQSHV